jgi:FlaA1/EpsC-like NDP-sugar epimerase
MVLSIGLDPVHAAAQTRSSCGTNPAEAVKNNCVGTRITAGLARYRVERFVHLMTRRQPVRVWGRLNGGRTIIQDITRTSRTVSPCAIWQRTWHSGSVLLRFQDQIKAGGPVTVTHPDIERYFMLIPEAVQLVLQAATVAEQGGIYVLDMGEQIKILSLATNLISCPVSFPERHSDSIRWAPTGRKTL